MAASGAPTPVLVSGGSGGIGSATVTALRKLNRNPLVLDVSCGYDAADPESVRRFLRDRGCTSLGAVVALAGKAGTGGIEDTDLAGWHDILRANLDSAYVAVRESLPLLRAYDGDRSVVLMSSVNGRSGGNALSGPAYATAKAGLVGLGRNLARTLADDRIRVNVIAPGPVETSMYHRLSDRDRQALADQIPLGHTAEPSEIAGAIAFLLSPAARSITGAVLDINGGLWMG